MTKTILITGATDGIGLLTAKKLAAAGHTVLLHGRSPAKLEKAAKTVGGAPETYVADLSDLTQVAALADAVLAKHDHLDGLINNAGVLRLPSPVTPSGLDARFVVNTLAPYVLTQRLLSIIPKTGRVVNLSSAAQAPVDVQAMMGARRMDHMEAYAQSKLAITIWSMELAERLPLGPAVIAVNPGSLLASKMVKEGFGVAGNDLSIGADILIKATLDDSFAAKSGAYFDNDSGRFTAPHHAASRPEHRTEVMQAIEKLIS
ncbi:SDR family NAD(P)-dependent oxidoreductase [Pacificoceanicola onchidii]|uniref:SDR family NAD(P)-dependent oxidoreductase n=1 Tax=Pacificoceanicola onchidii TaxID=2562685 RepID=UPI0010A64D71|nr:SDR family NAD(P)-dependent oxidoreductase [Pacificoceanicola onchidii]